MRVAAHDDDGYFSRFDKDDLLHVVVPDDLSELHEEVAAYRHELELARREERRRRRRSRLPRWMRSGLPSPLFTAVLLAVATTGLLLSVFAPVTREQQQSLPVSSLASPKEKPGTVGGLLPDFELVADSSRIGTRVIRPAVFILIPPKCDCANLIRQVVGQANEVPPAPYTVVVSKGKDTSAAKLADAQDGGHGQALGVRDEHGILASTYHASATAPTLLFVAGDGVVLPGSPYVFHDGDRLENLLQGLHF